MDKTKKEIQTTLKEIQKKFEMVVSDFKKSKYKDELKDFDYKPFIQKLYRKTAHIDNHNLLEYMKSAVKNIEKKINDLNSNFYRYYDNGGLREELDQIIKLLDEEPARITYLEILKQNNLILVGKNGAGKSAFSSFMKNSISNNIIVIPAHKYLFYSHNSIAPHKQTEEATAIIQDYNYNEKYPDDEDEFQYNKLFENLQKSFTAVITSSINKYVRVVIENERSGNDVRNNKTILEKFEYLWQKLIPEISWKVCTDERIIRPNKDGKMYNMNDMSDGEKVIIYYLLTILNTASNSYIVVDEPETYMNPSIYKKLWDILEKEKNTCTFIYISHNVQFINSRYNHDLYWIKSFDGNQNWQIEQISKDQQKEIPSELLTELLGSEKPILFCEGTYNSLDIQVYSLIFGSNIRIYPVNGHHNVINFTRSCNNLSNITSKAYGIVDRDQYSPEQLKSYEESGVYALRFNEIEMFLLCDEILNEVIVNKAKGTGKDKDKFKEVLLNDLCDNKTDILNSFRKAKIDNFFANERIDHTTEIDKDMDEIFKLKFEKIKELQIDEQIYRLKTKIENIVEEKNYNKALQISTSKDKMLSEASNILNKIDYTKAAIDVLRNNEMLREQLIEKYFPLYKKIVEENEV